MALVEQLIALVGKSCERLCESGERWKIIWLSLFGVSMVCSSVRLSCAGKAREKMSRLSSIQCDVLKGPECK